MEEKRVQRIIIKQNNKYFNYIKYLCKVSKNLYNTALFIQRQAFFDSYYYKNYNELDKEARLTDSSMYKYYHILPQQIAQQTLKVLDKNWKSFFESVKEHKLNPSKFKGWPKPPKYKDKDSYFNIYITEQHLHFENNILRITGLSNFLGELKIKTNLLNINNIIKLNQLRILPRGNHLIFEVIYTENFNSEKYQGSKTIGIDIGIDNLLTVTGDIDTPIIVNGKGLKSINQYYNKKKAEMQSELILKNKKYWSNKLQILTDKRKNKIEDVMHKISKWLINFCLENGISTIVIGKNKDWKNKSSLSKKVNQNFVQIPFGLLEKQIEYKTREVGINLIWQEESYTSKASFIDKDIIPTYKKAKKQKDGTYKQPEEPKYNFSGKRIKRGLYQTKYGQLINADVNGSLNILRKSNVTCDVLSCIKPAGIGFVANPVKINIY